MTVPPEMIRMSAGRMGLQMWRAGLLVLVAVAALG